MPKTGKLLAIILAVTAFIAMPAAASLSTGIPNTQVHVPPIVDENGVDLATGEFTPPLPTASIGTAESGLFDSFGGYGFPKGSSFLGGVTTQEYSPCNGSYCDEYAADANKNDNGLLVYFGNYRLDFGAAGQEHFIAYGRSDTLDGSLSSNDPYGLGDVNGGYTLVTSDGTVVEFGADSASDIGTDAKYAGISSITKPDGEVITFSYNVEHIATPNDTDIYPGGPPPYFVKVSQVSVHSSLGWSASGSFDDLSSSFILGNSAYTGTSYISYGADALGGTDYTRQVQTFPGPSEVVKEQMTRIMAQDTNSGSLQIKTNFELLSSFSCTVPNVPTDEPGANPDDALHGAVGENCELMWQENYNKTSAAIYPSGRTITATYYMPPDDFLDHPDSFGGCLRTGGQPGVYLHGATCVHYIDRGNLRWTYSYSTSVDPSTAISTVTTTRIDPLGHTRIVKASYIDNVYGTLVNSVTDELNRTTTYEYYGYELGYFIKQINYPEGNHTGYHYDSRGNLTEVDVYPKDGSAPIVTTAGYDTTCANPKTCNKPNWTRDAKNQETDYTYDPTHGGILTETGPADAGNVRPQKRYTYAQITPHGRDASGNLTNSTPVWRVVRISTCLKATSADPAWCVANDPADEQVTTFTYNNNVLKASETIANGSGSLSATTSFTYDRFGNLVTKDGPRTDVDDKTYTVYDDHRRPIYEIGADPDGSGPLKRTIIHHVYDVDGNEIRTETGSGTTITYDSDGAPSGVSDFAVTSFKRITFDPVTGLLIKTELVQP